MCQVEEHLAGHGAEVSKLRTARDDSLQVAAALRKRLESAEAALGGLQHFEQQQQAQQAQAQQRAQQQAQQLAQQLAQVQQAQQQAARITDLGAELARAAAALAAERIAHAAAAAELQTLKAEATTLRADGAANHARMLLLTRESTALMRNAYAADLAKVGPRTHGMCIALDTCTAYALRMCCAMHCACTAHALRMHCTCTACTGERPHGDVYAERAHWARCLAQPRGCGRGRSQRGARRGPSYYTQGGRGDAHTYTS